MRALFLATVFLAGCAQQVVATKTIQSYQVGQNLKAAPGGIILIAQTGEVRAVKRWVGVANSSDGWQGAVERESGYLRKELIYSGINGSNIEIGYREFRGGLAAPAFYQSAKYDLAASREITFQNFRIRVDSADNNGMTGVLISDGVTSANPLNSSGGRPLGKNQLAAEALARTQSCATEPQAKQVAAGSGFESYSVACHGGDVLLIRCEYGQCRLLR